MVRSAATPRVSNHEAMICRRSPTHEMVPSAAANVIMQMASVTGKRSVPGHVPPDFREVGLAGTGFMDELAVEHHHQTIR